MTAPQDPAPRKALGRGLAALIPPSPGPTAAPSGLRPLPLERVKPRADQPRKHFDANALDELAASIRERGILQPIVVRRHGDGYEIVAGERRWRAASQAGLREIPAIIKDFSDTEVLYAALVENIQRQDLDPLEEAAAYSRLAREYRLTQEQIAQAVGKSRVAVANALRLLNLPPAITEHLAQGRLTPGHARALMTVGNEGDMLRLAEDAIQRRSSVRDLERRARAMARSRKKVQGEAAVNPNHVQLEERLMRALGTKVRVHARKGKGRIEVIFHSLEQLDGIIAKLGA